MVIKLRESRRSTRSRKLREVRRSTSRSRKLREGIIKGDRYEADEYAQDTPFEGGNYDSFYVYPDFNMGIFIKGDHAGAYMVLEDPDDYMKGSFFGAEGSLNGVSEEDFISKAETEFGDINMESYSDDDIFEDFIFAAKHLGLLDLTRDNF